VQKGIKGGYGYAVDVDLSKFFDKVDHDLLMNRLGKWVADKQLLALIGKYLRAEVSVKGRLEATQCGVPQGGPLSPLLANIMLDDLDRYLESKGYRLRVMQMTLLSALNLSQRESVLNRKSWRF